MRQRWLLPLVALAAATPALAESNYRYALRPEVDVYFGHISYCELKNDALDPRVVRAEGEEIATVNLPLVPGDTILTSAERRCEAQFDTGTLLRLDRGSELRIETMLARSITTSDKLTNLHLETGRLHVLYRDYDSSEVFQILTPNAAIKLHRSAVVDVRLAESGETRVAVERGSAEVLYGPSAKKTRTRKIKAGEQATVGIDDQLALAAAPKDRNGDAFLDWNREMNERFVARHEGKSALPKPIARYPRAVINFAQHYSDNFGEWIWTDLYGYVWRPFLSRDQQGWRPFLSGRWVPVNGRQFWVPEESWGWVPYHLGLLHWDKKHGWVWLPGSAFAPAWVSWSMCDDFRYYRPLTLWDWRYSFNRGYGYARPLIWSPCSFDRAWPYEQPATVAASLFAPAATPLPKPSEDEAGPTPIRVPPDVPLLPLPPELEKTARRIAGDIARDGADAREALVQTRLAPGPAQLKEALREITSIARDKSPGQGQPFRDWNADVRAARDVGGHIVYSSVTNLVRCENCSRPLLNFDDRFRAPSESRGSSGSSSSDSSGSSSGGTASSAGSSNPSGNPPATRGGERIRD